MILELCITDPPVVRRICEGVLKDAQIHMVHMEKHLQIIPKLAPEFTTFSLVFVN